MEETREGNAYLLCPPPIERAEARNILITLSKLNSVKCGGRLIPGRTLSNGHRGEEGPKAGLHIRILMEQSKRKRGGSHRH